MVYTDDYIKEEMLAVYKKHGNKIPKQKDWNKFSSLNSSTICRRFGGWNLAWESVGLSTSKQRKNDKKIEIINDFRLAYEKHPDVTSNKDLVILSGHRMSSIYKYFVSLDGLLNYTKIDARKRINKSDVVSDYINVYNKSGRLPTKKDISLYGKYKFFVYLKHFDSLDDIAKLAGIEHKESSISKDELIDDIFRVRDIVKRIPTSDDIYKYGKFSSITYDRYFGGLTKAIKMSGIKKTSNKKIPMKCQICNQYFPYLTKHIAHEHQEVYKSEVKKVIELCRDGLSAKRIATDKLTIFNSSSTIIKILSKHISKDERKKMRIEKIKNTTNKNYSDGKMNRVIEINTECLYDEGRRKKISEGLKKAYKNGNKVPWNVGQTKDTDERIKKSSEKASNSIKELYKTGELTRNNSGSVKRYRLGAGFRASDRRNIKKRANYRCEICGIPQENLEDIGETLECDHILPICKGGTDDWENNGQAVCGSCHKKKTLGNEDTLDFSSSIDNDIGCKYNEVIVYRGNKLTKKYISSLSYEERYLLARHLRDYFLEYDFINTPRFYDRLKQSFENIKNHRCVYNKDIDGHIILSNKNNCAIDICHYYFPNILKIKHNNRLSVIDVLTDKEMLLKVIMNRLGGMLNDNFEEYFNITPSNIIIGAKNSRLAYKSSIFKPSVAKEIYNYWIKDGDIVYDYSSGFGGRLLGFCSAGINAKYIGTDVEPDTYNGLCRMKKDFNINADIYNIPSEELNLNTKINFAFSSPPYFDHEIYSDNENQSCVRYKTFDEWIDRYWNRTVKNIKDMLLPAGVFAVNVGNLNNQKMISFHDSMVDIIKKNGFCNIDVWKVRSSSSLYGKGNLDREETIEFFRLGV